MSLAGALEAAAGALPRHADAIRPANGDPYRLLAALSPDAAAEVLAWLLAERPDDGEELAEAWCDDERGFAVVLALREDALPKPARKRLRRLHHRLRSAGVPVPKAAPAPTVARLPGVEDDLRGAYVTRIDGLGTRILWLVEPHPSGGARLFELSLDDARGVTAFQLYTAPRRNARRFLRDLTGGESAPVLEIDVDTAHALVARVAAQNDDAHPAPASFFEWRTHLGSAPAGTPTLGDAVERALGPGDPERLGEAVRLVEEGKVGPWPADREVVLGVVERLRTAADSPLIVSGAAKREQLEGIVVDALFELLDERAAGAAAHRFRDSAWFFWKTGDESAARACLSAAASFGRGELRENAVARALVTLPFRTLIVSLAERPEGASAPGAVPK
jgi:hypothetical protein